MAMNRCPICGEKYSDTYKDCPFCEEEEALLEGEPVRRPKRTGRSRQFSIVTPMLIVLILIMAGLLFYLLRDNTPKDSTKDPTQDDGPSLPSEEVIENDEKENTGTMPEVDEKDDPTPSVSDYEQAMALPEAISVNNSDFTLMTAGETFTIKVTSGGNGSYTWVSQDPTKVSVDANGKVTALNSGVVNVVVTDGTVKGVAIVRVKKGVSTPVAQIPTTTPSTGSSTGSSSGNSGSTSTSTGTSGVPIELNREDMTLSVGESFTLNLIGYTGKLTWSIADSGIASISSNGTVKGLAQGRTTATVTWDGGSASCVVRVK